MTMPSPTPRPHCGSGHPRHHHRHASVSPYFTRDVAAAGSSTFRSRAAHYGEQGPRILVGDFDTTSWSHAFREFASQTDRRQPAGNGRATVVAVTFLPVPFRIPIYHRPVLPEVAVVGRALRKCRFGSFADRRRPCDRDRTWLCESSDPCSMMPLHENSVRTSGAANPVWRTRLKWLGCLLILTRIARTGRIRRRWSWWSIWRVIFGCSTSGVCWPARCCCSSRVAESVLAAGAVRNPCHPLWPFYAPGKCACQAAHSARCLDERPQRQSARRGGA